MSTEKIIAGFAGLFALGMGFVGYEIHKANKALKKVGLSFDKLKDETEKDIINDIRQEAVNKAINDAVDRKVSKALADAENTAVEAVKTDISKRVRAAVDEQEKDIRQQVTDEIAERVSQIDDIALKKDVTEKAKKEILRRFDGSLDGVLNDLNRSIGTVTRIYENFGNAVLGNKDEGHNITLKL